MYSDSLDQSRREGEIIYPEEGPGWEYTSLDYDRQADAIGKFNKGIGYGQIPFKEGGDISVPSLKRVMVSELPKAQEGLFNKIFKRRVLNKYPVMKNIYGNKGEDLNIIRDRNFDASSHGFGDIEFIFPGSGTVNYTDDYTYQSPTPDKYTSVYNPKGAARGDVFLDMLHGMRNDPGYMELLQNFGNAVKDARGKDMQYYYEQDLANNLTDADKEGYDNNYIDGLLRAHLYPYTPGKTVGRKDYDIEKQVSSPEMYSTAMDVYNYLRAKPQRVGAKKEGGSMKRVKINGLPKNWKTE
jgi:hypothetical protein